MKKEDEIAQIMERTLGRSIHTRRKTNKILKHLSFNSMNNVNARKLTKIAHSELCQNESIGNYVKIIIEAKVPDFRFDRIPKFNVIEHNGKFIIDSDVNFEGLNEIYHKTVPKEHDTIGPATFLSALLENRVDSYLASNYMSEYVTNFCFVTPIY